MTAVRRLITTFALSLAATALLRERDQLREVRVIGERQTVIRVARPVQRPARERDRLPARHPADVRGHVRRNEDRLPAEIRRGPVPEQR